MPGRKPHKPRKPRPQRKPKPSARRDGRPKNSGRGLPDMLVLQISGLTEDGEAVAVPNNWDDRKSPPHILVLPGTGKAPAVGERVLANLHKVGKNAYEARIVKILAAPAPKQIVGIFTRHGQYARIEPVDRRIKDAWLVAKEEEGGAQHGELVSAELTHTPRRQLGPKMVRVTERLGDITAPKAFSLIAIHTHGIPTEFSEESLAMAEDAQDPVLEDGRVDLRKIPLVTIDGADARDFDDAVFAEPDTNKDNPGGWHAIVAIADVAHYVPEGSALDKDAYERGNSVYFTDRVVPMLPKALSNGLCSLNPAEDRYCLAVHLWISQDGNIHRWKFVRGLMRSAARLTYEQAQEISERDHKHPLYEKIIKPLWGAYGALAREWEMRGTLDLNLPEFKVELDENGTITAIAPRERLTSHRLIETYMVAANVAAAECLLQHRAGGIYRVHESPSNEKLDELRKLLEASGHNLAKGNAVRAKHFNSVLRRTENTPEEYMVHTAVLRAQMQAFYHPENTGHFGLSLAKYCHFTSPIRRYADLVVHRALIGTLDKKAAQALSKADRKPLAAIAEHISMTERRAMLAERDTADRYKVVFMSARLGETFRATVTGINGYGLFATIGEFGVTGFIPIRALGDGYFRFDERHRILRSNRGNETYRLGQELAIVVEEANKLTGNLLFSLQERQRQSRPLREKKRPPRQKHRPKR